MKKSSKNSKKKKLRPNPFDYEHLHNELLEEKRKQIKSFKAKMDLKRSLTDRMADFFTMIFGSSIFLFLNFIWFVVWMVINLELIPSIPAFDPFPFGLLTMVVSLEAIFLSIFVLISQNRASKVADIREEIDLRINVRSEREITKILCMVDEIHDHLGLDAKDDEELKTMKTPTNLDEMEEEIEKEIEGRN